MSYTMGSVIVAGFVCVHERNLALANVVSDWCIAVPVAALALATDGVRGCRFL